MPISCTTLSRSFRFLFSIPSSGIEDPFKLWYFLLQMPYVTFVFLQPDILFSLIGHWFSVFPLDCTLTWDCTLPFAQPCLLHTQHKACCIAVLSDCLLNEGTNELCFLKITWGIIESWLRYGLYTTEDLPGSLNKFMRKKKIWTLGSDYVWASVPALTGSVAFCKLINSLRLSFLIWRWGY